MPKKRFLAGLGVTAALAAGGIGAAWLAAPVISGAQTTDTTTPPATGAPAPDTGQAPAHTPGNCPHMGQNGTGSDGSSGSGGTGATSSGAANLSFRTGGGFVRL